jgi:hypothetical protein
MLPYERTGTDPRARQVNRFTSIVFTTPGLARTANRATLGGQTTCSAWRRQPRSFPAVITIGFHPIELTVAVSPSRSVPDVPLGLHRDITVSE